MKDGRLSEVQARVRGLWMEMWDRVEGRRLMRLEREGREFEERVRAEAAERAARVRARDERARLVEGNNLRIEDGRDKRGFGRGKKKRAGVYGGGRG